MIAARSIRAAVALSTLPLLLGVVAAVLSAARGPFHQGQWTDPDYCYLLSALTIAEGSAPHHVDHPGTPVQVLGAVVLRAVDLAPARPPGASLRLRVLGDPERYLVPFGAVLALACCATLYAAGYAVWRTTGRLSDALLCQLGPLLSWQALTLFCRVMPEPLLATLGACLGAFVVATLATGDEVRWPVLLGIVLGLGIAAKVPFSVLAIVPLAALGTWRGRARWAGATALTLALALLPIWSELPRMLKWLIAIGTHSGHYGSGRASVVDWPEFRGNLATLPRDEPLMFALAGGSVILAALVARARDARRRWRSTLLAIAGAQVLLLLLVAKHPRAHYLIPGSALTGATLEIGHQLARGMSTPWHRRLTVSVGGALVLATLAWNASAVLAHRRALEDLTLATRPAIALGSDTSLVHGTRTSSPAAALQHGNYFANGRYAAELRRLHPGFVTWDWNGLHHFGQPMPLRERLEEVGSSGPSFRYVSAGWPHRPLGAGDASWARTTLSSFGPETLYRVFPSPAGAESSGAFRGFFDAAGLDDREGPYAQLGIPFEVRRGRRPATTLWFCSDAGPRELIVAGWDVHEAGAKATLDLDGRSLTEIEFGAIPHSPRQTVRFVAPAGIHELRLTYVPPSRVAPSEGEPAVLFRRITID